MAAPIVTGIAALLLQQNPRSTVLELIDSILASCKDLGAAPARQGRGLVQVRP